MGKFVSAPADDKIVKKKKKENVSVRFGSGNDARNLIGSCA
jgi:hypothetical protein